MSEKDSDITGLAFDMKVDPNQPYSMIVAGVYITMKDGETVTYDGDWNDGKYRPLTKEEYDRVSSTIGKIKMP